MNFEYDLTPEKLTLIENRKVLLFDISIWNRLADKKTKESIEVCEILIEKQKQGEIFCPLAAPTIWELRKQAGASFMRTATLMEELSLNITFRDRDQIVDFEIENFLKYLLTGEFIPLSKNKLFGPLLSYLSPSFKIDNIDKGLEDFCRLLGEDLQTMSVTTLMKLVGENSLPFKGEAPKYQKANINRRKEAKGNKGLMRRLEIESIAKSIVIPKLNKKRTLLPIETQITIVNKINNLPRSKKYDSAIEHILSFLPIVSAYIDILTISGYDTNRKDSDNDFYDIEIMTYGLSYPTIFSAVDKWIKSLMESAKNEGNFGGYYYAGSLSELREKL